MNKKIILSILLVVYFFKCQTQTLYVPEATGTTPGLYKSNTSYIGIGTDNPQFNLHIKYATTPYAIIRLESGNTGQNASTQYVSGGSLRWELGTGISSGTSFELYDRINNTHRLIINQNGNVGIGTNTPNEKLHVISNDSQRSLGLFGATGTGEAGIYFDASNGDFVGMDYGGLIQSNDLSIQLSNAGSNPLYFKTADLTRMTISGGGNIGIGTTNPKNLLDVKGTIHAQEVKVDMNNWSDFVFHPSYQLKPLTEVEKFIKANGHLQDIPSAAEVEQNGVNVGEMQAKLLQKVEELTLYVIEKDKEIAALKTEKDKQLAEQQKLLMELKNEIEILKNK